VPCSPNLFQQSDAALLASVKIPDERQSYLDVVKKGLPMAVHNLPVQQNVNILKKSSVKLLLTDYQTLDDLYFG
jgi:hypothetical protein